LKADEVRPQKDLLNILELDNFQRFGIRKLLKLRIKLDQIKNDTININAI